MTLSVLIVNWNTRDLLRACLQSLRRHPPAEPMEVWVLDNASRDGSAEMVQEEFPEVHLIASDWNLGYAAGNNRLIQQAQGEYLLLLNPDTEVTETALDTAVRFMQQHPEVGALGAKLAGAGGAGGTVIFLTFQPERTLPALREVAEKIIPLAPNAPGLQID